MQNQDNTSVVYGGFFVRLAAYFVDLIFMGILLLAVKIPLWVVALANPNNFLETPLIFQFSAADIFIYLLGVLYFVLMTYYSGATIGKKLFGLKVISSDGTNLTLINVLYRETIGRYLSMVILWIGYFLIGVDSEKRGFHDMLCDTRVIYNFGKTNQDKEHIVSTHQIDSIKPEIQEIQIPEEIIVPEEVAQEDTLQEELQEQDKKYKAPTYSWKKE